MKIVTCNLILIVALILFGGRTVSGREDLHHQEEGAEQSAANPLIEEMTALDRVYREVVSAVALGDSERAQRALEPMHGAMEKTHEGIHAGSVTLPKNSKLVKEFEQMDRRFHEKLESLARAARHNNQKEMLRITKMLLDGCVRCHQTFRK